MNFELEIIHWLQSFSNDILDAVFNLITALGEETVLILVLGFMYWVYDKVLGEKIGFTIFVSLTLNSLIKLVIQRPRPFVVDNTIENMRPDTAEGFSFPSGHTQTAASESFSLYYFLKKRWLLIVAIVVTTLVAISRMYLGVHYLTDVLVGALLGIGIAWFISHYYDKIKNVKKLYDILLIVALVAALLVVIVNYANNVTDTGFDAPNFYFASESVLKMIGTIAGFILGIRYEKKNVGFANHRRLWPNVARLVLGIIVILAVRYGLKFGFSLIVDSESLAVGNSFEGVLAVLFDFIRYTTMLFVGIGLFPKLFKLLNI